MGLWCTKQQGHFLLVTLLYLLVSILTLYFNILAKEALLDSVAKVIADLNLLMKNNY